MGYLRITSGNLKGRRIVAPPGRVTRPLLSRLRKSLCDVLRPHLEDAVILELFGGSGAISLDLLSNGAERAVIAEMDPDAAHSIKKNVEMLNLNDRVRILTGDGLEQLQKLSKQGDQFDIVIIAPPYHQGLQQKTADNRYFHFILKQNCLVVVQRHRKEDQAVFSEKLLFLKTREYGNTVFDFYEKPQPGKYGTKQEGCSG